MGAEFGLVEYLAGEIAERDGFVEPTESESDDEQWADIEDGLFNKEALQEYILMAAQMETGGLRDKPGKSADAYHTLYNLAGLSCSQHRFLPSRSLKESLQEQWDAGSATTATALNISPRDDDLRRASWLEISSWIEDENGSNRRFVGGKTNRVNATHPLLSLTMTHSRAMLNHFYGQSGIVYV